MPGPAKKRLHDYEANWLSMLVKTSLAPRLGAEEPKGLVMQEAIELMKESQNWQRGTCRWKSGGEHE